MGHRNPAQGEKILHDKLYTVKVENARIKMVIQNSSDKSKPTIITNAYKKNHR